VRRTELQKCLSRRRFSHFRGGIFLRLVVRCGAAGKCRSFPPSVPVQPIILAMQEEPGPQLENAVATARQHAGAGVIVIDGGGNRAVVDDLLASISTVILLPFTADDDSVYVVAADLAKFPQAFALPSNWPTNSKAANIDAGYINKLDAQFPGRILPPIPATHAVRDFVLSEFNGILLPPAQRYCRVVARQVAALMDAVTEQAEQPAKVA
jgi:hypothetical protein